jgi:tetratricopeptide (TPR) repeat protein
MKTNLLITLIIAFLSLSCSNNKDFSEAFIQQTEGRYFYNPDEIIEVFFKDKLLHLKWRSQQNIKPLRLNDSVFYVKEMNEKIIFRKNNLDNKQYICMLPKDKNKAITYDFRKMLDNEDVPSAYLKNKEYDKALDAYLALQKSENANKFISERTFNKLGYKYLREKKYEDALAVFKINVTLFPESSNVYDSLADLYAKKKDTVLALENYKKSLAIDSGNRRAKRYVKKYDSK